MNTFLVHGAIKLTIISIITLMLLYSKSELRKWRYEELVQSGNYGTGHDLGIGAGSFDIGTISWKTENQSPIPYQTLLVISKTGSGDELYHHFDNGSRDKYGSTEAVVTVKTVLKIRKLIIFAVNEINSKLKNEGNCTSYFANPLTIHEIEEFGTKGNPEVYYRIKFHIEPGHFLLEASIRQDLEYLKKPFIVGVQNELELISAQILELDPQYRDNSNCTRKNAGSKSKWSELCVCSNVDLVEITNRIRNFVNMSREAELDSWLVNTPMLISNYFSYGLPNVYLVSPRNQIQQRFCNPNLNLLIVIHSSSTYYKKRMEIRETWGSQHELEKYKVGLLFFIGKGPGIEMHPQALNNISTEAMEFDDIVMGDFLDTYKNLPLKALSVYNWIYSFCMKTENASYPSWILKADDDMLVNVEVAVQIAKANSHVPLLGFVRSGDTRYWNKSETWYTPRYLYMTDWYPTFFPGPIYMIQTSWIPKYLQASLTSPILHVDDVYVTGLLSLEVGLCPMPFPTNVGIFVNIITSCYLKQAISSTIYKNRPPSFFMKNQWESLKSPEGTECKQYLKPKVTEAIPKGSCVFSPICPHFACTRNEHSFIYETL